MKAVPVLLLFGAAALLGAILGLEYLRRVRSRPVMIGMHFLLGAAGVEVLVFLMRGAPDGTVTQFGTLGNTAAAFLVFALFVGVLAPMIGRRSRATMNVALFTHVGAAGLGLILLVAWFLGQA